MSSEPPTRSAAESPAPGSASEAPLKDWRAEPPSGGGLARILLVLVGCGALSVCGVFTVGVFSAIAIPNFIVMSLRAKRSEAPTNLDSIRITEQAYHRIWDEYYTVGPCPPGPPGRAQVPFEGECAELFREAGWSPSEGMVRCQYTALAIPGSPQAPADFQLTARCDLDGDGVEAVYEADRTNWATLTSPNTAY